MAWSRVHTWVLVTAAVLVPVALALLTWWASDAFARYDTGTDYDTLPPSPVTPARLAVAVPALLALVAGTVIWLRATGAGRLRAVWTAVLGLLAFAALIVGGTWSIARLDTTDANIGGGIAVLFGLPLAGALVIAACCWSAWLIRTGHGRPLN